METTNIQTATKWALDPTHSEAQFKVKHLVISTVTGTFKKFDGSFESTNDKFENARIQFSIDVNSIDTNQEQRDIHLKSADFFDAEKFPEITFTSASFKLVKDDKYSLTGELTLKGISHPVQLDVDYGGTVVDPYGNTKAGFEVTGNINRKDFGLTWSAVTEAGSIVVSEQVKLQFNVQFVLQKN
jgi:polyisoprenoid-binding protein YceI